MALIAFFIPINKTIVPILIGILLILSFFDSDFINTLKIKYQRNISLLMASFYIITALSLLWTDASNLKIGFFDIEVKLSLLVFPIIFLNHGIISKKGFRHIIFSFVLGNFVSSFILLIIALYRTISTSEIYLFYNLFSFYIHPSYFALYILFAISGCIYLVKTEYFVSNKWLYAFSIYFFIIIFLLSSKAGFLILLIIVPLLFLRIFNKFKYALITSIITISMLSFVFIEYNFRANYSIKVAEEKIIENKYEKNDYSTSDRKAIYETSIKLILDNPFLGYGAGDIKPVLFQEYEKRNMQNALVTKLNVHNQFLETFIGQGIIGFLITILLFIYPLVHIKRYKKYLLLMFIIVCGINFLFESMLNTQAGVVFFAFFYLLLNFVKTENNDKIFAT